MVGDCQTYFPLEDGGSTLLRNVINTALCHLAQRPQNRAIMKEICLVYVIQNNACVSSKLNSAANIWPYCAQEHL